MAGLMCAGGAIGGYDLDWANFRVTQGASGATGSSGNTATASLASVAAGKYLGCAFMGGSAANAVVPTVTALNSTITWLGTASHFFEIVVNSSTTVTASSTQDGCVSTSLQLIPIKN